MALAIVLGLAILATYLVLVWRFAAESSRRLDAARAACEDAERRLLERPDDPELKRQCEATGRALERSIRDLSAVLGPGRMAGVDQGYGLPVWDEVDALLEPSDHHRIGRAGNWDD